jgi:hypothetical protein
MRALKNLFGFVLMVLLLMLLVGFFLPGVVRLSTEQIIGAPKEVIYEQLHQDAANNTFRNDELGISALTITNTVPNDSVTAESSLGNDYKARIVYKFHPTADSVRIRSTVFVDLGLNPISRYYGLVLDAKLNSFFERNLLKLKQNSEERHRRVRS